MDSCRIRGGGGLQPDGRRLLASGATPKDAQPPTAVIKEPTLTVDGCQIKVHLASDTPAAQKQAVVLASQSQGSSNMVMQPGPLPAFALEATNPGTTPATIHFSASLRLSNIRDEMSRVPRPPAVPVWHQDFSMTLQPGQTQSLPIAAAAKVDAGDIAMLSLENGNQQITALTLSAAAVAANGTVQTNSTAAGAQPEAKQIVAQAGQ